MCACRPLAQNPSERKTTHFVLLIVYELVLVVDVDEIDDDPFFVWRVVAKLIKYAKKKFKCWDFHFVPQQNEVSSVCGGKNANVYKALFLVLPHTYSVHIIHVHWFLGFLLYLFVGWRTNNYNLQTHWIRCDFAHISSVYRHTHTQNVEANLLEIVF